MVTPQETPGNLSERVIISPPKFAIVTFNLVGISPYVQLRFSEKAKAQMREKMVAGSQARKGRQREARDFEQDFVAAQYQSDEGWSGIPAGAFRSAAISACRIVGFKMTMAKLSLFVEADGVDSVDGTPLVRIEGTPESVEHAVRNATGVADLRIRAMWREWTAELRVRYDTEQFSISDVSNLLSRVGMQVGIGEGRPDSPKSEGMGWGLFRLSQT